MLCKNPLNTYRHFVLELVISSVPSSNLLTFGKKALPRGNAFFYSTL